MGTEEIAKKNVKMEMKIDQFNFVENQGKVSVAHLLKEKITVIWYIF